MKYLILAYLLLLPFFSKAQEKKHDTSIVNFSSASSGEMEKSVDDEIVKKINFGSPTIWVKDFKLERGKDSIDFIFQTDCSNIWVTDLIVITDCLTYHLLYDTDFAFNQSSQKLILQNQSLIASGGILKIKWLCRDTH
jgi:hypothetical protein